MAQEAQQVSLRWSTPDGRINPRAFRQAVGFELGKLTHDKGTDWGWLFNSAESQPEGGGIATVRFSTGNGRQGAFASIVAIGDETCSRFAAALPDLLPAVRAAGIAAPATVDYDRVWLKPSPTLQQFRVKTIVLTRLKGDRAFYDRHRAEPALLVPFVKRAVANGINNQARRLGFEDPCFGEDDIGVLELGKLGTQPVVKGKREAMLSRLSQAVVTLPCRLNGDWRVGGLLTYGNGLINPVLAERHWRDPDAQSQPFPTMRHKEEVPA